VLYGRARQLLLGPDKLFRVQPDAQVFVVKEWPQDESHDLIGGPRTGVIKGADGLLYGLSSRESTARTGVAFTVDLLGNAVTLSSFAPGPPMPVGPLVESAGALYGASCAGGTNNYGTLFRVGADGAITTVSSFGLQTRVCPTTLLKGSDGEFYGNTFTGSIFRATHAGDITVLHQLGSSPNPQRFPDQLTADAAGNLWANWQDAAGSFVYRVTPAGAFTRFDVPADAGAAGPGVAVGPGGNLFGPLHIGGTTNGSGQLFRMTPGGEFTPLFRFPNREFVLGRLFPAAMGCSMEPSLRFTRRAAATCSKPPWTGRPPCSIPSPVRRASTRSRLSSSCRAASSPA